MCNTTTNHEKWKPKSIIKFSLTPIRIATVKKKANRKTENITEQGLAAPRTLKPTLRYQLLRKNKFCCKTDWQGSKNRAQICLSNPRLGQKIRGWGRS